MAGKAAQGLADVNHVIAQSPKDARVHDTRGLLLEDLGRIIEAIESYRAALAIDANLESSSKALKRLGAHESEWVELKEIFFAWVESVARWVHAQWESPNKSRWALPIAIFLYMLFGKKPHDRSGSTRAVDDVAAHRDSGAQAGMKDQTRFAWWAGSGIVLLAALAWATR